MGSLQGNWPSRDPHNFSQLRPADPAEPSNLTPITYHPTHNRTLPPPNQVISTEETNILLRQFYQRVDEKMRTKRAAPDNLGPNHGAKLPRGSSGEGPS
ncbi:unnamed protein product [Spirodela intermedia]|uniref:DET1- and DDB1-associated protein 1 domain-containing protein n=2 Tax=Spirodela intermedia TaxID=51605 RepID=A0A7I8JVE4_SPIIN|nr:unnamed protein product [Spirodela intermedia]CAA6673731.1 unnamed protein product [Spirodela intermedia]CAA7410969.1 unnamed protein product [Spirodela intermedia]